MLNTPNTGMPSKSNPGQGYVMTSKPAMPNDNSHNSEKQLHGIEMLKLELKYKGQIT